MGLTFDDLRELLAAFETGTWQEMTVIDGSDQLHVSRRSAAAETVVDRVTGELPSPASPVPVIAPSIGIFRRAASPGEAIGPTDAVGMIDVSGSVRPVPAGVAGTVGAVLVDDGAMVEYGQPVAIVSPANL